jgi:hypothetical protein
LRWCIAVGGSGGGGGDGGDGAAAAVATADGWKMLEDDVCPKTMKRMDSTTSL